MAQFRCPALGDCDRANANEVFEHGLGDNPRCPGCDSALEPLTAGAGSPPPGAPGTKKPKRLLIGGALSAALVASAVVAVGIVKKPKTDEAVPPTTTVLAPASSAASSVASSTTGIAPDAIRLAADKASAAQGLESGNAAVAATAAARAASNELIKLGIAKLAQGELAAAESAFEGALAQDGKNPLAYYNHAVLRMRQARTTDALKSIEAAFLAGFTQWDAMDRDTDLEPLRKDDRFVSLVARYRK